MEHTIMTHGRGILLAFAWALLLPAGTAAQSADTVIYYHTDAIGSVRAVTDANGGLLARYDFEPFGIACGTACGTGNPPETIQFAGKERDADTALDYFGARYYQSQTGRFTTVDPDHVGGNIFDPQSWNGYAYARNNPLSFIDPTGTDYYLNVYGGDPFWFDQGFGDFGALRRYLSGQGFRTLGDSESGVILNAAGQWVADYSYSERSARVFGDAGRMADAGVRYSASVVASNFLGSGVAVGLRWGAEALVIAAETKAAQMVGAAAAKRAIAGVLKQIAQGTTKGKVFQNVEGRLPVQPTGYYREYTVPLAGQVGRGAARLVRGAGGEVYYTADHYAIFVRIQ